ncbi:acetylglutamate kinase [Psychroflexus montanilacus]|uniref:acetylglutamate kinase n=1 Tax=Psychroflexus montanilacus TaxID=2873598 RepID=UPI001CCAB057|nr:acetylglutamate kinase [Psychroflexus montanilacus]MBZ9650764.1 acetylglutamate kinase [Psychroflexus montanilacus]
MQTLKIIKIGGQIIEDKKALKSFLKDFSELKGPKILIHGGGLEASKFSERLSIKVSKIDGRRITDAETLEVTVMTYAGLINKNIVARLQGFDCNALGFTGADANTILSEKRATSPIDFGFVGDIVQVNTKVLETLMNEKVTPVFCAITHDKKGQLLNTNADTLASELAIAFSKIYNTELYFCFEKNGVLTDVTDENSVVKELNYGSYQHLLKEGKVADGMIPKLDNCFRAIDHKVSKVCIGTSELIKNSLVTHTKIIK